MAPTRHTGRAPCTDAVCGPTHKTVVVLNSSSSCTWSSQAYETDGHTWINTDNRTECAALKIPSVFHTSNDRPTPRKWLSSSCCYGLPGRTPISPQETFRGASPPLQLLHPKFSITFSGSSEAGGGVNPIWGRAYKARSPCTSLLTPHI